MANFFQPKEVVGLDKKLINRLNIAREAAGLPFIINSGFRTPEKSVAVGGYSNDPHTKGLAADIRVLNSEEVYKVIYGAFVAGMTGIGIGKGHIHMDIDDKRKNPVFFVEK